MIQKLKMQDKNLKIITFGLFSVTLYFNPSLADPFNTPKMIILLFISIWAISNVVFQIKFLQENIVLKLTYIMGTCLILSLTISAILSQNKLASIVGENYRKNGLLTYIALVVFFLLISAISNLAYAEKLIYLTVYLGQFLCIYGFLQHTGRDPVQWNNIYNPIILTVGNPNFSAALMAIIAVLIFVVIFHSGVTYKFRIFSGIVFLELTTLIILSKALQGIISLVLGVSFVLLVLIYFKSKKMGYFIGFTFLILFIFALLGMLQVGPLSKYLYKNSVSLRGYYWRAGIEMFRDYPFFGVGIDNYGSYFKEYREPNYSLNYGYEVGSNNAHNTFIQFFATGGLFAGIIYLTLMILVFSIGIKSLRSLNSYNRLIVIGLLGSWLAFQSQSFVSIDNIGLSIWNYSLSGIIIAVCKSHEIQTKSFGKNKKNLFRNFNSLKPLITFILLIPMLIFSLNIYRNEKLTMDTYSLYSSKVDQNTFGNIAKRTLNQPMLDNFYRMGIAARLSDYGFTDLAIVELKKIINANERDLQTYEVLSRIFENQNNYSEAIKYREKIVLYDPWNTLNYLKLGRLFKQVGNYSEMKDCLIKINSFAASSELAITANIELVITSEEVSK